MRASHFKIIVLIPMFLVLSGCNKSQQQIKDEKAKTSAQETLKALHKLEAATEVGVTKVQYGILLIDAKAALNETNHLSADESLKKELNAAMQVYQDASTVWGVENLMDISVEPGKSLFTRYKLPRFDEKPDSLFYNRVDPSKAVGLIWPSASPHLEEATKILESDLRR